MTVICIIPETLKTLPNEFGWNEKLTKNWNKTGTSMKKYELDAEDLSGSGGSQEQIIISNIIYKYMSYKKISLKDCWLKRLYN